MSRRDPTVGKRMRRYRARQRAAQLDELLIKAAEREAARVAKTIAKAHAKPIDLDAMDRHMAKQRARRARG